jgi:hypothetical protein
VEKMKTRGMRTRKAEECERISEGRGRWENI